MKKVEYKVALVENKVPYIKRLYCDRCNNLICVQYEEGKTRKKDVFWYSVTTGHHDWGNDSIESIEHKDICRKCISDEYADYVERAGDHWNTEYIEIEHERGRTEELVEGEEKE